MLMYEQHPSGAWAARPAVCVKEASPRCASNPSTAHAASWASHALQASQIPFTLWPVLCLMLISPQSCQPCAHPPPLAHHRTLPWPCPSRTPQVLRSSGYCWWAIITSNWRCFTHRSIASQQYITHVHPMGANLLQFCLLELRSPLYALFLSFLYLGAKQPQNIPGWKGPAGIIESSSWLHAGLPKSKTSCLRDVAVWKYVLPDISGGGKPAPRSRWMELDALRGRGTDILSKRCKGSGDVGLNPWVYWRVITDFNSLFQKKERMCNLSPSALLQLPSPPPQALLRDLVATVHQPKILDSSAFKTLSLRSHGSFWRRIT